MVVAETKEKSLMSNNPKHVIMKMVMYMGRSRLQGTAWHYVNRWELKPKDEFEWETNEKRSRKKKKKKKRKNKIETNYVELSKKNKPVEKKNFKGSFTIKFDGEEEKEYIIGKNISGQAEILKKIYQAKVGDVLIIDDERMTIIKKNIY